MVIFFVNSTIGKGSIFSIEIPIEISSNEEMENLLNQSRIIKELEKEQPEYRILVVEDKLENSILLSNILQKAGFKYKIAENGLIAIELFKSFKPHLIWMDWRMPVMDGLTATKEIRMLDGGIDVKIIALTASVFKEQKDEVLSSGVDDFIRKPYSSTEIYMTMQKHLGVRYTFFESNYQSIHNIRSLEPELFKNLSNDIKDKLIKSLNELNTDDIINNINIISKDNQELGKILMNRANNYKFTEILNAVKESN